MNAETMPLKHDHHQPPCAGANQHSEEAAPFLATTTTTRRTRVTRAALVLCGMAALVGVVYPSHRHHLRPVYAKSDAAAGGVLREGSGDWTPIPKEALKCYGHTNYDGCLNGRFGPNEVHQFSGREGIWVFDVGNIMGYPCPACDNVPDCDQFCNECAGGPVQAGACSADNQYFCLPECHTNHNPTTTPECPSGYICQALRGQDPNHHDGHCEPDDITGILHF